MTYRHAFRVGEVIDLRRDQVDFKVRRPHVNRLKKGDRSVRYLEDDELRSLRQQKRELP